MSHGYSNKAIRENRGLTTPVFGDVEAASPSLTDRILSLQLGKKPKAPKSDYLDGLPLHTPHSLKVKIMVVSQFVRRVVDPSSPAPLVIAKTEGAGHTFSWGDSSSNYLPTQRELVHFYALTQELYEQVPIDCNQRDKSLNSLRNTSLYKSVPQEVRAFFESWVCHSFDFRTMCDASAINGLTGDCVWHDYFSFLAMLRKQCQRLELRKSLYDRNVREPKKRFVKLQSLLARLFERYSRILVVRVDLKYKSEYAHDIEFADFQANIKKVSAAATKRTGNFKDCLGFALRIEDAPGAGLHCHAAFFFHGGQRHQDIKIAQLICLWWDKTVTMGKGRAWNVNQHWQSQSDVAPEIREQTVIGSIDRRDEERVLKMVNVMGYLCIAGQDTLSKPKRNSPVFIVKELISTNSKAASQGVEACTKK